MSTCIDERTVRHVAHLSRLQFSDQEVRRLAVELSAILEYVEQLNRVDTADVEPTAHPLHLRNVFRDDTPQPSIGPTAALANAPQSEQTFFRVPKVLDQGGASE
ncbi:MAG: Asp-tRNA(Asn)/Glu-tRNA(Gln) amidotransferase subunit GatC [Planctomycetes bacterium]|nr:Asp-tRNA(Asn)/Glu-tRNA(Gln) amidotransferase subunit GatC [Planctomycetota bacterium]